MNTTTIPHAARPMEYRLADDFGAATCLKRIPCACGWRGCWFAKHVNAEKSYSQHGVGAALGAMTGAVNGAGSSAESAEIQQSKAYAACISTRGYTVVP
jgi:hypothetical protein